ncbi:LysR family transcriptional regulator [Solibacillus sp. FSL K6-1523]|uniref:LysR family transcriptional regulator n=1 Tax=Solibacillus sp. FSL K6-1523 TaxID=2921471 RepID=UPI0030F5D3B6
MNLHRLHCFVTVVEEGSVSKAAKVLKMSQPPLSMLIRKLEEELNVTLFERYKKRLLVTETGQLLYERAKELLSSSENIVKEITEHSEGVKGIVRIGTSTSANITIIPSVIEEINKQSLNITLDVREGKYTDILRELRNNEIDIGLVRNTYQPEDIEIIKLLKEPLLLALPPDHHLLQKSTIELNDLRNEKFLMQRTTQGQNISDFILEACHMSDFTPNIVYWGTTSLPILLMVRKGVGISFVPQSFLQLQEEMKLPPMVKVSSSYLYSYQSLIMLKDRYRTSASNRIIEIIKKIAVEASDLR